MKILAFTICLGLFTGLTACQNQGIGHEGKKVGAKTFAGEAVDRAKVVSKIADEHNREIAEQAGE